MLKPIYQKLLFKHRFLCYEIEKLRFVDVSDNLDIMNLDDFANL